MRNRSKIFLGVSLTVATAALADLAGSYVVPLDDEAIRYATRPADESTARSAHVGTMIWTNRAALGAGGRNNTDWVIHKRDEEQLRAEL